MEQPRLIALCDRCLAEAPVGEPPFEDLGDLLEFEPVPRRNNRVDGWTAECQRAFIAALATTGSPRQAARQIGKSEGGLDRLRQCEGAEGFNAAWDRAQGMAAGKARRRIAAGLGAIEPGPWSPPPAPGGRAGPGRPRALPPPTAPEQVHEIGLTVDAPPADGEDPEFDARWDIFCSIAEKYALKVAAERDCRLAGKVVEADFTLRQITAMEVMIDLLSQGRGTKVLELFRSRQRSLLGMAETPLSRLLGEVRRETWEKLGEPERPEHPPRRYLDDHGDFCTEPLESLEGGRAESLEQQRRFFEERHRRDAEAQIEWEARARQEFESRRDSATRANS